MFTGLCHEHNYRYWFWISPNYNPRYKFKAPCSHAFFYPKFKLQHLVLLCEITIGVKYIVC